MLSEFGNKYVFLLYNFLNLYFSFIDTEVLILELFITKYSKIFVKLEISLLEFAFLISYSILWDLYIINVFFSKNLKNITIKKK